MRRAGVSPDRLVVVYDDADSTAAARVWWSLRYFGHDKVRVLDGGYRAWTEAGLSVTTEEPEIKPGDFLATPGRLPVLDAEGAAELARGGVLLDARSAERYRGEQEPVDPVAGHIPAPAVPRRPGTWVSTDGSCRRGCSASGSASSAPRTRPTSAPTAGPG
ncbi:sulfurtransferase [Actinomadura sp. CNU-125]|uniref:sulfurtransferase n=1 Tax=Actinomadura sp. CNU-125 TaxID=1904961 RepID=UPI0021CC8DD5|nr:rhodanese-like domain-containing protein [Actinomadura sp. CNU-125]